MTSPYLIKIGKQTAIVSFLIGTCIFLLFLSTNAVIFLIGGYFYILVAGLVNSIMLILLLVRAYIDKVGRRDIMKTGGLMLLNIPAAVLYSWIAISLSGL